MEIFSKLFTIVTKNSMLDIGRSHEYIFHNQSLFLLFHRSSVSQQILKNLNKIHENQLRKSSLLKRRRFLFSNFTENTFSQIFTRILPTFCKHFFLAASKLNG